MGKRSCPQCGAPYDPKLNKCPYCLTSYFDMSAIDITRHEPFYLKIRTGNFVFTSKVMVDSDMSITVTQDDHYVAYGQGHYKTVCSSKTCDIDMRFHSVAENDGTLWQSTC